MSYYNRGGFKRNARRFRNNNGTSTRRWSKWNNGSKGNFTYGNVLDKVVSDVGRLKGLINTEFKSLDVDIDGTVSVTPSISLINASVAGDDFDTRDGRVIRIKSVQVSLTLFIHASAVNTWLRCMLVIDKQPNEILLVIGDLIDTTVSHSMRNLNGRKRFVILKDELLVIGSNQNAPVHWEYYSKMDMKTVYDDSNVGSIVDITSNALYLVLFSSEATNVPSVGRHTRVRYIDN